MKFERPFAEACLQAVLVIILFAALSLPAKSAVMPESRAANPQPESTRRMIERLAGISREVDPFMVPYFAGPTADLVRKKFAQAITPGERATLQWKYALALLNDGRSEEALQALDE